MEHFDDTQAVNEGWGIVECHGSENGPYQLQRIDEYMKFENDDKAWLFVYEQAHKGSAYHQQALDYLSIVNEQEYNNLITFCRKNSSVWSK